MWSFEELMNEETEGKAVVLIMVIEAILCAYKKKLYLGKRGKYSSREVKVKQTP